MSGAGEKNKQPRMTRREFLKSAAVITGSLFLSGLGQGGCASAGVIGKKKGAVVGASFEEAHKLKDMRFPAPTKTARAGIVIVGGGISGLSAAWHLTRSGYEDAVMLELEPAVGGNSASGKNEASAYPWGAHYVPIPGKDAILVIRLFEELGVIKGYKNGLPIYDETMLCADLSERLYVNGAWQEGLIPQVGISEDDKSQYDRFFGLMESMKNARGKDNLRAFAIPVERSSRDLRYAKLDKISMAQYMKDNKFDSKYLLWYVDYCCRDDYGAGLNDISAWAGVHYFASRSGKAANAEPQAVLTWPEGNGWIARGLKDASGIKSTCNALAYNVENYDKGVMVDYYDIRSNVSTRITAEAAIVALPRFVAKRVVKELREAKGDSTSTTYSPWVVANITVKSAPVDRAMRGGAPLAWDNVSCYSRSLGYTNATHQTRSTQLGKTVLTWYMPLDGEAPARSRDIALSRDHKQWVDIVIEDLSHIHPGIESEVENIDVWVWGHGMIRPVPGFIWGEFRQKMTKKAGRISFAHSDMSGISIFEEALYRGVEAADITLSSIGHKMKGNT